MNSSTKDWIEQATFGLARVSEDGNDRLDIEFISSGAKAIPKTAPWPSRSKVAPNYKPEPYHHAHLKRIATATRAKGGGDKSVRLLITLADAGATRGWCVLALLTGRLIGISAA